jgi:hypothetical protein
MGLGRALRYCSKPEMIAVIFVTAAPVLFESPEHDV